MLLSLRAALVLVVLFVPRRAIGQSVHEMMAKEEEEREARMEARMQAQWRAMTGEAEAPDLEKPSLPTRMGERIMEQPPPRQIGVKTARSFMKDIIAALTTTDAALTLDAARSTNPASSSDDSYWQTLVRALGPALEKYTKAIVQRYGFASDFEKAMASVGEAQKRKDDRELASAMQHLNEIFTGEHAQMPDIGVVPGLSQSAGGFLDASQQDREDALEDAIALRNKTRDSIVKSYIDMYLEIMRGIQKHGEAFLKDGISDIVSAAKEDANGAGRAFHERESLEIRTNILVQFLRQEERRNFIGDPPEDLKAEL